MLKVFLSLGSEQFLDIDLIVRNANPDILVLSGNIDTVVLSAGDRIPRILFNRQGSSVAVGDCLCRPNKDNCKWED